MEHGGLICRPVLAAIWHTVEVTHIAAWATVGFDLLKALQIRVAQTIPQLQVICVRGETEARFQVREGQISGWHAWYVGMSKSTKGAWSRLWERMPGCAPFAISDDVQRISTVVHFALYFRKARTEARGKVSIQTRRTLSALQHALLDYLSQGLYLYIEEGVLAIATSAETTSCPCLSQEKGCAR